MIDQGAITIGLIAPVTAEKGSIGINASYRCSKLFEAVGLNDEVVELCFKNY
ncbi:hypothetical protein PT276_06360 [Orbaceae bacterium ESL0721]|nr:hypothetical protein [Orbaceae bacterium ESL0721]